MHRHEQRIGPVRLRFTRRSALRHAGITTVIVAAAPVLQACGSDEPSETALAPNETESAELPTLAPMVSPPSIEDVEPVATSTPSTSRTAADVPPTQEPAAPPDESGRHLVEMNDQLQYDPSQLTLRAGETVPWRTVGVTPHTSTGDPTEAQNPEEHVHLPPGAQPWNSGIVNQDEEFEQTFDVPGEYTYFCIPHEAAGMIGYLTVEA